MNTKTIELFEKNALRLLNSDSRVLEVGSLDVNGSVSGMTKKVVKEYIGIDIRDGEAVDCVMDAHGIPDVFGKESFDMVICFNTLEHDDKFWVTLSNMYQVLKTGGYLVLSVPDIGFSGHDHPEDYWRFTKGAIDLIFEDCDILVYDCSCGKGKNWTHFCMGRKR